MEYEEYKDMKSTEIAAEVKRRIEETIRANELKKDVDKKWSFKYNNKCATKDAQLHNLTLVK